MATRAARIPEEQWESHKDTIRELYLSDNLKLTHPNGLIHAMVTEHAFSATKAQFESHLKKRGFVKNRTQSDWKIVGKKLEKRARAGKASEVVMNGKPVPPMRVQRQIARYKSPQSFASCLEASSSGLPELGRPVQFIDPQVLHSFRGATLSLAKQPLANQGLVGTRFNAIGWRELGSNRISSLQKSLLPATFGDHGAAHPSLMSHEEDLSERFSRLAIFSIANGTNDLGNHLQEFLETLKAPSNMQVFQRLRYNYEPEIEAFVEKLFGIAIEAEDAGLVGFLLKNTALDPNILALNVEETLRTPIERSSQLQSIGVTKVLLGAAADVNKSFQRDETRHSEYKYHPGDSKLIHKVEIASDNWHGALRVAIGRPNRRPEELPVNIELIHILLEAGAMVEFETLATAIRQKNPNLVQLLVTSCVKTSYSNWILEDVLEYMIDNFNNDFAIDIVKCIAQPEYIATCAAVHNISKSLVSNGYRHHGKCASYKRLGTLGT